MVRDVIRADGRVEKIEVGNGFETWNKVIGASCGTIVSAPGATLELWCDDNGLLAPEPRLNLQASILACQQIVGDVIVFKPGDIK